MQSASWTFGTAQRDFCHYNTPQSRETTYRHYQTKRNKNNEQHTIPPFTTRTRNTQRTMPYLPPRSLREDSDFSHPGFPIPLVIFLSIAGVFILCVVATCVYSYNYRKKLWSGYYSGRPLPRGTRMASTKGSQEDSSYLLSAPPPYPGVEDFERHHHRSHSPGFGHGHHGYGGGDGGGDTVPLPRRNNTAASDTEIIVPIAIAVAGFVVRTILVNRCYKPERRVKLAGGAGGGGADKTRVLVLVLAVLMIEAEVVVEEGLMEVVEAVEVQGGMVEGGVEREVEEVEGDVVVVVAEKDVDNRTEEMVNQRAEVTRREMMIASK
ncbi:hypothetical protein GE09DRAFT_1290118 [Coniochaeta sp. 2T2.1]|nr:hypothetical protein GE09DRAFT_1290118 [Coniochaeta sp. 2T2.1]